MIPITPKGEPPDFNSLVRVPGRQFLRRVPKPTGEQFKGKQFWRKALPNLRELYGYVCAYCSCWIPFEGSVDHFEPKSTSPNLAYEWSNFRLAQEKVNNAKGDKRVLDPFHIQPGWFVLDFASAYVKPNTTLAMRIQRAVKDSIDNLDLNSQTLVRIRYSVVKDYANGVSPMPFLDRYFPFIASELKRQGVVETIKGTIR